MTDLVVIENNQSFTTSLAISEGTNNTHEAVLRLVKRYQSRFEKYKRVRFEVDSFQTKGGMQVRRIAILDERQAYLLMTMLRNTEKVLDFKEALVDSFMKARELLQTGQMGLLQKHAILSLTLEDEKRTASNCGRGLADWKRKRDGLHQAIVKVERQMQPNLPFVE